MGKNGKLLNLNSDSPKYGNKSLVTKEQENELKRRKITFSFSYFKQIPNFQIGECSKGWHIGLLERLGALGTMTPQEVLEENRGSIALRCHPIQPTTKGLSQYDDLLNKLERIKSIVSDCSDKKCKLHSHISVIEELHDNIVYIGLDNDFYSTYQEILKKIPLQKILENGILVSMDNA